MKNKLIGMIVSLLMLVSIISVGFASWQLGYGEASNSISGSFNADDVVQSNQYINVPVPTALKYNKDGFIGTNDRYTSSIVCENIAVYVANSLAKFKGIQEIELIINLDYIDLEASDMNIFESQYLTVYLDGVLLNEDKITRTETGIRIVDSILISDYEEDNIPSIVYKKIEYKFELTDEFFTSDTSPLWTKSAPVFTMKSSLLFN